MTHENDSISKEERKAEKQREEQIKTFQLLNSIKLNQANNLDRNLITLSSASVGLIVTVLIQNKSADICYLKVSLIFFVITIMSTVISFFISIKSIEKEISILNKDIEGVEHDGYNKWSGPIEIITMLSIISFCSGVFFLLVSYF